MYCKVFRICSKALHTVYFMPTCFFSHEFRHSSGRTRFYFMQNFEYEVRKAAIKCDIIFYTLMVTIDKSQTFSAEIPLRQKLLDHDVP